jgi:hypothetical protein
VRDASARLRRASLPALLGLAILFPGLALGSEAREVSARLGPVTATVTLEPEEPVIGDPMKLTIVAVAEEGVEVLMPEFGEALDRFSIVDFVPRESVDPEGRTVLSQRYTLQAPASGEHTLPSLLIEFVDRRPGHDPTPEDQDAYELLTDSLDFAVQSVVPDSATADLSPPMGKLGALGGRARSPWPIALVVGLALMAGAPFAYRAWLGYRERRDIRSAYEIARGELDALLAGPRPGPEMSERIDAFFVALSGIVRRYLERRFALRAPELTTERFLEFVSASPDLTEAHQELLRDFLRQSDLVKFAHVVPSREAIEEAITFAGRFLDETRDDVPPSLPPDAPADAGAPGTVGA